MSSLRGPRTRGEAELSQSTTLTATESGPDSTGTTAVGEILTNDAKVVDVQVDGDVSDYDFNVNLNGNPVFTAAQSPAGTAQESFFPDDEDKAIAGVTSVEVEFEITSAGSAGSVDVFVEVEHE